jgi:hypothetical protein
MIGQTLRGAASIESSTLTFGLTDYAGLTDSTRYDGAEFDSTRALAKGGRETLIAAGTAGLGNLVSATRHGHAAIQVLRNAHSGRYGATALHATRLVEGVVAGRTVYEAGHEIAAGHDAIRQGDWTGYLRLGLGGLNLYGGVRGLSTAAEGYQVNFPGLGTNGPVTLTAGFNVRIQNHHLMTNKNGVSSAAGGPYTPLFEKMARRRGITLGHAVNKVGLIGHQGPHPGYNQQVYNILDKATKGKRGESFNQAFDRALEYVRKQTLTVGTLLNKLATGNGG